MSKKSLNPCNYAMREAVRANLQQQKPFILIAKENVGTGIATLLLVTSGSCVLT